MRSFPLKPDDRAKGRGEGAKPPKRLPPHRLSGRDWLIAVSLFAAFVILSLATYYLP
jgi:hypothetical protein